MDASGNLARAVILLRCRLLKYTSLQVQVILDDPDQGDRRAWYLLVLRHHSRTRNSEIEGLVVELFDQGYYRRAGYFRYDEGYSSSALGLYHAQEERMIQLW
jgi:hypothetical protein